jgi:hypothetical protein
MEGFTKMKRALSLLFFILFFPESTWALSLSGNLKAYPIISDNIYYVDLLKSFQGSAKLQVQENIESNIKIEAAYELTTFYQKYFSAESAISSYRATDLNVYLHKDNQFTGYHNSIMQNLNRLNMSATIGSIDFTVGRQPIAFGSAKSINPTDVLTPFAINTIDKEERTGVDAVTAKIPLIGLSTLEVGAIAGKDLLIDNDAFYLRPKFNFYHFDLAMTVMKFNKKELIGLDIQHPIEDAGFWIESAFVNEDSVKNKDFIRSTVGLDYKFQSTLYLCLEYHYNGISSKTVYPFQESFVYLKDKHYEIITASYEFTPLLVGTLQTFFNNSDYSTYSNIKFDYNLTDNIYLGVGSILGIGDKTTTELGKLGKTYYSSLRYYF